MNSNELVSEFVTLCAMSEAINPNKPVLSDANNLEDQIKIWGKELGFADVGISDIDLSDYETQHFNWIGENFHGDMDYMARHGTKRTRPNELEPGTNSIISVRMNYLDNLATSPLQELHQPQQAYISRYALGKDYHKLIRKRLQALANKIDAVTDNFRYRAFTDSAPVLERPIAEKAGLGFIGKNSLIIHPRAGSWFFLGEIYCNLPLTADAPFNKQGCGPCQACIQECPTQAIVDNAVVDSRRCISYLTIEYKGSIPTELRPLMGNRIYGCDDCQLVCPWNKFTQATQEPAFSANNHLDSVSLHDLWQWSEKDFLKRLEGSPIRRIGYQQWKRNLAVALGNIKAPGLVLQKTIDILQQQLYQAVEPLDDLVLEHIGWAINELTQRLKLSEKLTNSEMTRPGQLQKPETQTTIKPFVAKKYYLPK